MRVFLCAPMNGYATLQPSASVTADHLTASLPAVTTTYCGRWVSVLVCGIHPLQPKPETVGNTAISTVTLNTSEKVNYRHRINLLFGGCLESQQNCQLLVESFPICELVEI